MEFYYGVYQSERILRITKESDTYNIMKKYNAHTKPIFK